MRDKQKLLQELEATQKEYYELCHDKQWKLYIIGSSYTQHLYQS